MSTYEVVLLIRTNIALRTARELLESYATYINQAQGYIIYKEYLGLRTLAYSIKNNKSAYYLLFVVKIDNTNVQKLERDFSIKEEIIKQFFLKISC